jgi:uncharacterized protein YcnI
MRRAIIAIGIVAGVLLAGAVPAWAHVSVSPSEATRGGFATLTFQVPNETDNANTTKVSVQFPQDHPIADASVRVVPGWTAAVLKKPLTTPVTTDEGDTLTEAVNTVTWTATGDGIAPGYFEQFQVSVGLPAEGDTLTFPAVQTYSNGDIVRWIDPPNADGTEPENPAPTVTLTAGEGDHATTSTTVPAAETTTEKSDDDSDTLAIVAIVVGGVALLAALGAFAASRRRTAS